MADTDQVTDVSAHFGQFQMSPSVRGVIHISNGRAYGRNEYTSVVSLTAAVGICDGGETSIMLIVSRLPAGR
jgi:hypothetical protein